MKMKPIRIRMTKEQERMKMGSGWYIHPSFFIVHNTANDASARNEAIYMMGTKNKTSFHYAIDDKEVLQLLEVEGLCGDTRTQGSGSTKSSWANNRGISLEICYSKSGGPKYRAAENRAIKFLASELIRRGWGLDEIRKHQDFQNKKCPHRIIDEGWWNFIEKIRKEKEKMEKKKHWAEEDALKLKEWLEKNKMGTLSDMRLDDNITRGEVVSLLWRIFGRLLPLD